MGRSSRPTSSHAWPMPGMPPRLADRDLMDAEEPRAAAAGPDDAGEPATAVSWCWPTATSSAARRRPWSRRWAASPGAAGEAAARAAADAGGGHGTGRSHRPHRAVRRRPATPRGREPPPGTVVLSDGRRLDRPLDPLARHGAGDPDERGHRRSGVWRPGRRRLPQRRSDRRPCSTTISGPLAGREGRRAIARFQMAGGAVVTTSRVRREIETSRRRRLTTTVNYYVQPSWADQPMALPETQIAACGYRQADEVPLPLAAGDDAGEPAPDRPGAAVAGQSRTRTAACSLAGGRESDLGIAAHANSAIAFDLPAAASNAGIGRGIRPAPSRPRRLRAVQSAGRERRRQRALGQRASFRAATVSENRGSLDVAGLRRRRAGRRVRPRGPPRRRRPARHPRPGRVARADASSSTSAPAAAAARAAGLLPGLEDWELVGSGWDSLPLDSRWNAASTALGTR